MKVFSVLEANRRHVAVADVIARQIDAEQFESKRAATNEFRRAPRSLRRRSACASIYWYLCALLSHTALT